MDRYWEAAGTTQPPPVPAGTQGEYPTDGNLPAAIAPSTPGAWWYHQITEEIRNAIAALGGTPDFRQTDQLSVVIRASLTHLAVSINYNDLQGKPNLAPVATSGNYDDLNNKPAIQAPLGFTPVEQGGGANQGANKVFIGWDGGGVRCTIDATDQGRFVFEVEFQNAVANLQSQINANSGSGVGNPQQGWQDMTGQRALGTVYQNTTNSAIQVSFYSPKHRYGEYAFMYSADGAGWVTLARSAGEWTDGAEAARFCFSPIVPKNGFYRVDCPGAGNNAPGIGGWLELR